MAYALSIVDASKAEIPKDFAGKGGERVMEEDYVIVRSHRALAIDENAYSPKRIDSNKSVFIFIIHQLLLSLLVCRGYQILKP